MKEFKVVHITLNLPGPLALSRLAKEGANVTKIEPLTGDPLEGYYPDFYRSLHQQQKILRLDLKDRSAQKTLETMLEDADLFVTSLRPSALKKLGLDEVAIRKKHPKLQTLRVFGHGSPDEELPAHDLTCQAHAGLISPPALPRALIADFAAAERVFSTCLLALLQARTRPGSSWTVTMSEMANEFALPVRLGMTTPQGPLGGALPHYNVYESKDGWIAVAALEPHFLQRLLSILGLKKPGFEEFQRAFKTKTSSEWNLIAKRDDIPLAPVEVLVT